MYLNDIEEFSLKMSHIGMSGITADEVNAIEAAAASLVKLLQARDADHISIVITTRGIDVKYEDVFHINI